MKSSILKKNNSALSALHQKDDVLPRQLAAVVYDDHKTAPASTAPVSDTRTPAPASTPLISDVRAPTPAPVSQPAAVQPAAAPTAPATPTTDRAEQYANDITQLAIQLLQGGGRSNPVNYGDRIDQLLREVTGLTYGDWTKGDEYAALKGNYERQGQRAMQDTLAQVSARTGGMASSYAGNAAQGAYNEHMDALERAAMEMYLDERDDEYRQIDLMRGLDADEYSRGIDARNFAWNLLQAREDAEQQALENERYDIEYADRMKQQDWENKLAEDKFKDDSARAWYSLQNRDVEDDATGDEPSPSALDAMLGLGDPLQAQAYLLGQGFSEWEYNHYMDLYTQAMGERPALDAGNEELYNWVVDGFRGLVDRNTSPEMLRELLQSEADRLSEEQVESIMKMFGL